jgi:chromosome segregation protein
VYLKKLELLGFKSFADRTEFGFYPGITGIVGPNGCGKSNVVDAFKWIFGTQSAKGLRGSEMKDVIFNGTMTRKPAGYAEVSVVFDNQDGYLDIDYAEVEITRRLYRSGESEYLINQQKCRLKDIRDLFLDTGIGQTSYSILEQGKIDVLLQSSPEDRRMIFEEAAGISKYRVKKAETQRALLRVDDDLRRIGDILAELEKQIRRVKAQALRAQRYKELSERLRELRVRLALEDYHKSLEARVGLSVGLYWAGFRLATIEDLMARLRTAAEKRAATRVGAVERLRELRQRLSDESSSRQRVEERIEQCGRRSEELTAERARRGDDLEDTTGKVITLRSEIEQAGEALERLRQLLGDQREIYSELEARLEERSESHAAGEAALRTEKSRVVELFQKRSRIANQLVQISSELRNLDARRERLETALGAFRFELAEIERRGQELELAHEELEQRRVALVGRRDEIVERVRTRDEAIRVLETERSACQAAIHRKSSRFDVLRSFEDRFDGVAKGAAEILRRQDDLPLVARARGLVGALVSVERKYAAAIEAALGPRVQALVVDTHEGAMEILSFARTNELGGVEVIALDRIESLEAERLARHGGVLGVAREFVDPANGFEDLFDRLLVDAVLVEDLPTAIALARNGLRTYRLVTLAGEVVEPWGGFAASGQAEHGIISRRSEMDELRREVVEHEARSVAIRERLDAEIAVRDELRRSGEECSRELSDVERRLLSQEGERTQVQRERGRLRREIDVSSAEKIDIEKDVATRNSERDRWTAEEVEVVAAERRLESTIAELEAAICESARARSVAADAVAQARNALVQLEKQEETASSVLRERGQYLASRERHLQDLHREIEVIEQRMRENVALLEQSSADVLAIRQREDEIRVALAASEEEDAAEQLIAKSFQSEIDSLRDRAERVRADREDFQLRDQEERHRRNTILERIDEQYGIDLRALIERRGRPSAAPTAAEPTSHEASEFSGVSSAQTPMSEQGPGSPSTVEGFSVPSVPEGDARFLEPLDGWDRDAAYEETRELQDQLRKLGNVNLEALDEIDELEQQYEFQRAQKADLDDGQRSLRAIIEDLNRKSREMFAETFAKVQENFRELFRKSFGGGRAELVLEEGADILEAGIEIVARPPGKKLTSLSLMSGGEKTMTTIALLLAIFRSRPSPFCVLDEVDAPLDDANVGRFIVLLEEFANQSQFIIITHNKKTMAEASVLYGVTMQERGVSKRVAVELESYDPQSPELAPVADRGDHGSAEVSR